MADRFRVIFLGTPKFAVPALRALTRDPRFEVALVVSQPDRPAGRGLQVQPSPVSLVATELGLPLLRTESVNEPETLNKFADLRPTVIVVVAFGQILSPDFLALCPGRVVNVHSSLLPRWRGAAPMQRAILAGDTETGVCLQQVVFKLDAGDVIGERRMALTPITTLVSLHDSLSDLACQLVTEDLAAFIEGRLVPRSQDEARVMLAKKVKKEEGEIDWQKSAEEISRQVRALWPWPGTWTHRKSKVLKICEIEVAASDLKAAGKPGEVLECSDRGLTLGCGQGAVRIQSVQPESRGRMSVSDYLRGYPVALGEIFGGSLR